MSREFFCLEDSTMSYEGTKSSKMEKTVKSEEENNL